MRDTELYHHLLAIEEPWHLIDVELDIAEQLVCVFIDFDGRKASFCCPECGQYANLYDRRETRLWRHLDSCQFKSYPVASLPRVSCRKHGVLTPKVFWCEPNSRFTALFERFALEVLQATQVQSQAAKILRLTPEQVEPLLEKAVARGLPRRDPDEKIEHASPDETSFQQGHSYAAVLSDLKQARDIEMVEHRTQEAVVAFLNTALSAEQKASVRSVTMDTWRAFANARAQVLPEADVVAEEVHDRFQVSCGRLP